MTRGTHHHRLQVALTESCLPRHLQQTTRLTHTQETATMTTYTWHPERDGWGTLLEAERSGTGSTAGYRVVHQGITLADARDRYGAGAVVEQGTIPVTIDADSIFTDREAYASLADELNDADVQGVMTVADFDPAMVEAAARFAARAGLSFPPGLGDFDRLYEARCSRCMNGNHTGSNGTPGCEQSTCLCTCRERFARVTEGGAR